MCVHPVYSLVMEPGCVQSSHGIIAAAYASAYKVACSLYHKGNHRDKLSVSSSGLCISSHRDFSLDLVPRMIFDPPSALPLGVAKVIREIIARKEGEPGNEAISCIIRALH